VAALSALLAARRRRNLRPPCSPERIHCGPHRQLPNGLTYFIRKNGRPANRGVPP
jgi:hypothetical protein